MLWIVKAKRHVKFTELLLQQPNIHVSRRAKNGQTAMDLVLPGLTNLSPGNIKEIVNLLCIAEYRQKEEARRRSSVHSSNTTANVV